MKILTLTQVIASPVIPALSLEKAATRLLKKEGSGKGRVDIILVGNALLHRLNRRFRKKDAPTDVLSFNFDLPDFLGEIYISLPRVRQQAKTYDCSFSEELWRLTVHGLFHLLGYDHGIAMQRKEADYLLKGF